MSLNEWPGGRLTVSRKIQIVIPDYTSGWILDTKLMEVSVEASACEKSVSPALAVSSDDTLSVGQRHRGEALQAGSPYVSFYPILKWLQKVMASSHLPSKSDAKVGDW